eukprot:2517466-Pleurochrysis_carterae.AAC.1
MSSHRETVRPLRLGLCALCRIHQARAVRDAAPDDRDWVDDHRLCHRARGLSARVHDCKRDDFSVVADDDRAVALRFGKCLLQHVLGGSSSDGQRQLFPTLD